MTRKIQLYDGITGAFMVEIPYPTGGRLRVRATGAPEGVDLNSEYGSLDSTTIEIDGVTARGFALMADGSDLRNMRVYARGSDLSGAEVDFTGSNVLNTIVHAVAISDNAQLIVDRG